MDKTTHAIDIAFLVAVLFEVIIVITIWALTNFRKDKLARKREMIQLVYQINNPRGDTQAIDHHSRAYYISRAWNIPLSVIAEKGQNQDIRYSGTQEENLKLLLQHAEKSIIRAKAQERLVIGRTSSILKTSGAKTLLWKLRSGQ